MYNQNRVKKPTSVRAKDGKLQASNRANYWTFRGGCAALLKTN